MDTRSSTSKRKTGAETPSSQGEEEEPISESDTFPRRSKRKTGAETPSSLGEEEEQLISESDTLARLPSPTESEAQFIDDFAATVQTSDAVSPRTRSRSSSVASFQEAALTPRTRSQTRRESESSLNLEIFKEYATTVGTSDAFPPRTRSQTRRESESSLNLEIFKEYDPTVGTSAPLTPQKRSQTRRESESKSIPEASLNEAFFEDVPTGGTSAALTPRKRKVHFQRESESKASHENPTKRLGVTPPPGQVSESTVSTGSSFQIQTIRQVVNVPIGSSMPVSMQEQQGPI